MRDEDVKDRRNTHRNRSPSPIARKGDITDRKAPRVIQCGLYGAEMLSGSLGMFHAIKLLIFGMFPRLLFFVFFLERS
jgi:hypothetical protein